MDPGVALIAAAAIAVLPGIGAFIMSVITALQSKKNSAVLAKVDKQTNHMQEVMQAQAITLGIRTGQDEERSNPTAPGTPSPKLPETA